MTHADNADADGTHADDTHADDAGKAGDSGTADNVDSSPEDTGGTSGPALSWMEAMRLYVNRPGITDNTSRTIEGTLGTFFQDYVHLLVDKPEDVDPRTIREYLGRTSISDAYRLSLYSRLNAFYVWLVEEGHIRPGQNPMQDIERPEPPSLERPYLSPEEFLELTYAIEADYERRSRMEGRKGIKENELIWVLPPLKFGTATGLRPAELKRLRVHNVDFGEKTLQVPHPNKSNKGPDGNSDQKPGEGPNEEPLPPNFDHEERGFDREIPLCPMALEVAEKAAEGKDGSDYLFSGARSEQIDTRRLSRTVKRYIRKTGLDEELNFTNCTRHTCGSWLILLRYTSLDLMRLFGYSSVKSTEPYARLSPSLEELHNEPSAFHEGFAEATSELGFFPPAR